MPAPRPFAPRPSRLALGTGLWLLATAGGGLATPVQAQGVPQPSSMPTSPGIGGVPERLVAAPGRAKTDDDLPPMGAALSAPRATPARAPAPVAWPAPRSRTGLAPGRPVTTPLATATGLAASPGQLAVPTPVTNPGLRSTPIVEPLSPATVRALAQQAQEQRERAALGQPQPAAGARPVRLGRLAKGAPMRGGRLALAPCLNAEFFTVPTDLKGMLSTDVARFSYGLGYEFVESVNDLRKQKLLDDNAFKAGINDALRGRRALVSVQERLKLSEQLTEKFRTTNREGVNNAMQMLSAKNQAAAEAFLETNGKKPGVTTTPSGLQYEVLAEGSGPKPLATDTVTVNYRGTLENGSEFDSSYARNQPATFPLNRVIPGWTEGLQHMSVGSRYRFFIPPALGYGTRGAGGKIGPNALLIFEVELLKIN